MKQPKQENDTLVCPDCGEELAGDGENHLECMNCDYTIHEADITT